MRARRLDRETWRQPLAGSATSDWLVVHARPWGEVWCSRVQYRVRARCGGCARMSQPSLLFGGRLTATCVNGFHRLCSALTSVSHGEVSRDNCSVLTAGDPTMTCNLLLKAGQTLANTSDLFKHPFISCRGIMAGWRQPLANLFWTKALGRLFIFQIIPPKGRVQTISVLGS